MEEVNIVDLITDAHLVVSKSQARRLVIQGAIKVDEEMIVDINHIVRPGAKTLTVGKRVVTFRKQGEDDGDSGDHV